MATTIPIRPVGPPTRTRANLAPPPRVLICVEHVGIRELIGLMLTHTGCTVAGMDVVAWLAGKPSPGVRPTVLILDAWPLRHADALNQACNRLAAEPAAVVLLNDHPPPNQLSTQLGAKATLPLVFSLHNLITAVQQATTR